MARKEERRIEILEAATKVFASKGFHIAKVEEIAEEARVGKGTIYEYFASKANLFDEMVDHILAEYNKGLEAALASHDHIADCLLEAAMYHAGIMEKAMCMAQAMMESPQPFSRETMALVLDRSSASIEIMQNALKKAQSEGQVRPTLDCYACAHAIAGALNHYLGRMLLKKGVLTRDDAERVLEPLLKGLL